MYKPIQANNEQIKQLIKNHLKPGFLKFPKVISKSFAYDTEDNIGFVTLKTVRGKTIRFQLRNTSVMFVEFTGFGSTRYDVHYPEGELLEILTKFGVDAEKTFWKGSRI